MNWFDDKISGIEQILKLIDYIPVISNIPNNGRFMDNTTIDSEIYFESLNRKSSFRDIVRMMNTELMRSTTSVHSLLFFKRRYNQLKEIGCSYPVEYLLFDFCLAALDSDNVDAELYLSHCLHILGLNKQLTLLLSIIINEQLATDRDVRRLLALLAQKFEPRNAKTYVDSYGDGYKNRFKIYSEELRKLVVN